MLIKGLKRHEIELFRFLADRPSYNFTCECCGAGFNALEYIDGECPDYGS